jgi:hypothetical protein
MPKLVTAKRLEGEQEKAREYVRSHILFPSSVLGLIFMLAGAGTLILQFVGDRYGWWTFLQSTGLIAFGALLGWGQTRYHRYLLINHPSHFANRMKPGAVKGKAATKAVLLPTSDHPGRPWVPWLYAAGILGLFGAGALAVAVGQVYFAAGFTLPWAGFFWAKLYSWRDLFAPRR